MSYIRWFVPSLPTSACRCLLLAALLSCPLSLSAESQIRVAIPQVDPWGYYNEHEEPEGILVELMEALDETRELEVNYYLRPLTRALRELERGEVVYSIVFQSPRVEQVATPVGELVSLRFLALGPEQEVPEDYPGSLDDLAGRPVGFIRGTYYGASFHEHPGIVRVPVHDMRQGLELVKKRRLDAMVGSEMAIAGAYETMPEEERPALNILFELETAKGMFYRSKKAPQTAADADIKAALKHLRRSGRMGEIFSPRLRSEGETPGRWLVDPQ